MLIEDWHIFKSLETLCHQFVEHSFLGFCEFRNNMGGDDGMDMLKYMNSDVVKQQFGKALCFWSNESSLSLAYFRLR
jgi:hypothetical protein